MRALALATGLAAAVTVTAAGADDAAPIGVLLQHAGERVEQFFLRAQSLVCLEVVRMQPLSHGLSSDGFGRTVESELRVSWQPGGDGVPSLEAQTLRQVLRVNGHPPRARDDNNCTTPEQQSQEPQPLSLLLPSERWRYQFKLTDRTRQDGREAFVVEYRESAKATVSSRLVEGRDDCVSFDVDGGMRGRIWIDVETFDVLRLDSNLAGFIDVPLPRPVRRRPNAALSWTLERWDTSIRFRRVAFANPDETLVLPVSMSSLRITRGSGTPRLRTTTDYVKYQRFLTGGRVVGD